MVAYRSCREDETVLIFYLDFVYPWQTYSLARLMFSIIAGLTDRLTDCANISDFLQHHSRFLSPRRANFLQVIMAGYELIYYLTATGERIGYYGEDDVTVHIHISHCICNIKTTLLAFDHRQTSSAIRSYTTFAWSVMSEGLGPIKDQVSYPWRIDNVSRRLSLSLIHI